jgi:hypothetical protein
MLFMSVKEITMDQLPRSTRHRVSPIKKTKEWFETMAAIQANRFEALEIELSPETAGLGRVAPLRFRLMLEAEIKEMGRDDLKVILRKPQGRYPVLYVVRREIKKTETPSTGSDEDDILKPARANEAKEVS